MVFAPQLFPLPGFPHRIALMPTGLSLDQASAKPRVWGIFTIDEDCASDFLSSAALSAYVKHNAPVIAHCCDVRDFHTVLGHTVELAERGYTVVLLPPIALDDGV